EAPIREDAADAGGRGPGEGERCCGDRHPLPDPAPARPVRLAPGDRHPRRQVLDARRGASRLPSLRGAAVLHGPHLADRLVLNPKGASPPFGGRRAPGGVAPRCLREPAPEAVVSLPVSWRSTCCTASAATSPLDRFVIDAPGWRMSSAAASWCSRSGTSR